MTALADEDDRLVDDDRPSNGHGAPVVAPPADAGEPIVGRRERRERQERAKPVMSSRPVKLTRAQRKQQYRLRARKVKRVVRRFDAWSVMKVSLIFYLCLYVVAMVAGVILWNVAARVGVIDNLEDFMIKMGAFESFQFEPDLILEGSALIGAVLVVVATGMTVLGATLFNLISDLVGGIRMTVIEEDGARPLGRPPKAKRSGTPVEAPATVSDPATTGL